MTVDPCQENEAKMWGAMGAAHVLTLSKACMAITLASISFAALLWMRAGSIEGLRHYVSGDSIVLVNATGDVGEVEPESKTNLRFEVRNLGSKTIRLVGSQASCSCTILSDRLPIRIDPGASRSIEIQFTAWKDKGTFSRSLTLYTDSPSPSRLELEIRGKVVKGTGPVAVAR